MAANGGLPEGRAAFARAGRLSAEIVKRGNKKGLKKELLSHAVCWFLQGLIFILAGVIL